MTACRSKGRNFRAGEPFRSAMGPRLVTNVILTAGALGALALPAAPATAAPPAWRPFTVFPEPAALSTASVLDDGSVAWWAAGSRRLDTPFIRLRSADGALSPARRLERTASAPAIDPATGRGVSVRLQFGRRTSALFVARRSRFGGTLGPSLRISAPGVRIVRFTAGADAAGGGVVVWLEQSAARWKLLAARIGPSGRLGSATQLADVFAEPVVATNPAGWAVALWREGTLVSGTRWRLRTAVAAPGRRFGSSSTVASGTGSTADRPRQLAVTLGRSGIAVATWARGGACTECDGEFQGGDLYVATAPPGRHVARARRLSTGPLAPNGLLPAEPPAVAPSGEILVAWAEAREPMSVGRPDTVVAAVSGRSGRWAAPVVLDRDPAVGNPAVAFDRSGLGTVAWPHFEGPAAPILASVRPAGGRFSLPTVVRRVPGTPNSLDVSGGGRRTTVISWTLIRRAHGNPESVEAAIRRG